MNINLSIRYLVQDTDGVEVVSCFNHAVKAALVGLKVTAEVDEFGGSQDMRSTMCYYCIGEKEPTGWHARRQNMIGDVR